MNKKDRDQTESNWKVVL